MSSSPDWDGYLWSPIRICHADLESMLELLARVAGRFRVTAPRMSVLIDLLITWMASLGGGSFRLESGASLGLAWRPENTP